jgi:hypothetical protein
MSNYFTPEVIKQLHVGRFEMHRLSDELRGCMLSRSYKTDKGREFAHNGFIRRLNTMVRAVDLVYDKLPPELDTIPARDIVVEATLSIQAFVINCFGCIDNLAWIWVCEKPVLDKNGKEIEPLKVGLSKKNKEIRSTFSNEFVQYLDSRRNWLEKHLKDFRDSLAHRIPLYIPPYIIDPSGLEKYKALEEASRRAIENFQFDLYERLQAEQKALGVWRPWMTHSVTEGAPCVLFHAQLLQDHLTIHEFAEKMLAELGT